MPELTQAQKLLIRYCKERSFSDIRTTGAASIRATDSYGKPKELSINLYGDIIDLHKERSSLLGIRRMISRRPTSSRPRGKMFGLPSVRHWKRKEHRHIKHSKWTITRIKLYNRNYKRNHS